MVGAAGPNRAANPRLLAQVAPGAPRGQADALKAYPPGAPQVGPGGVRTLRRQRHVLRRLHPGRRHPRQAVRGRGACSDAEQKRVYFVWGMHVNGMSPPCMARCYGWDDDMIRWFTNCVNIGFQVGLIAWSWVRRSSQRVCLCCASSACVCETEAKLSVQLTAGSGERRGAKGHAGWHGDTSRHLHRNGRVLRAAARVSRQVKFTVGWPVPWGSF